LPIFWAVLWKNPAVETYTPPKNPYTPTNHIQKKKFTPKLLFFDGVLPKKYWLEI
jgi:hypothetical protein